MNDRINAKLQNAASVCMAAAIFFSVTDSTAQAASASDCFQKLERGRSSEIACEFPTRLTEDEKGDLKRLTRDTLQDARCVVSIRVERRQIDEALETEDYEFIAPPQPVRCEIVTKERVIPIKATFSPRVVFVAGKAIVATPGLAQVEGVPAVLAWPVIQYVNRAGSVQDGMLAAINAYRAHLAIKRQLSQR